MIEVKNVSKSFGKKEVLSDVNLSIEEGSVWGLVGINGAGKSTLLRLISGVLSPDGGKITVDGEAVYDNPPAKKKIFFLSDDPYYNTTLTGDEQARFYSAFYPFDYGVYEEYKDKFSLNGLKPIKNFSKGMKRQLFASLALACGPKYLLLDEAFDGLDPLARLELKRGLIRLQEDGGTVLISSHSLRELEDICDSFALLDGKRVKACGKLDDEISSRIKLQLVFEKEVEEAELPFACEHFEREGRVVRVVVKGNKEEILTKLGELKPLVVDEIPMDFEDMFIYEVEDRGDIEK